MLLVMQTGCCAHNFLPRLAKTANYITNTLQTKAFSVYDTVLRTHNFSLFAHITVKQSVGLA